MNPKIPKGWRRLRRGTLLDWADKYWWPGPKPKASWRKTFRPGCRHHGVYIYIRRHAR